MLKLNQQVGNIEFCLIFLEWNDPIFHFASNAPFASDVSVSRFEKTDHVFMNVNTAKRIEMTSKSYKGEKNRVAILGG